MSKNNFAKIAYSKGNPIIECLYFSRVTEIYILLKILFFLVIIIFGAISLSAQKKEIKLPFIISESNGFTENNGQILDQNYKRNKEVQYLFHGKGLNVQLKKNSFSYDSYEIPAGKKIGSSKTVTLGASLNKDSSVYHFHRVDIRFPGSNQAPQIVAEDQLKNYEIFCNAGSRGGIHVNSYKRIIYKEIYPHIDLVFESKSMHDENGVEYYFIVSPGGDAGKIRMQYNGAETKLENNAIIIPLERRKINETIPLCFVSTNRTYSLDEVKNESFVKGTYKMLAHNIYGFAIPPYDKTKSFIIDPVPDLVWGTYYGGSINDWANEIARSPDGTVVIVGGSSNDNLATSGAYQTTLNGYSDAMIGKFTKDGILLWMTYYGGEAEDDGLGVCTDNTGNIYVVGITDSKTNIATPGSFQTVPGNAASDRDAFIAKFNPSGSRVWSTYYGGNDVDNLDAVKTDKSGNLFVAGWTFSANGIATPGCFQPAYASDANPQDFGDGFIARFNNNGNRIWGTYFGSTAFDRFYALDIDSDDNLYAAGITFSSTNIATSGAFQTTLPGANSAALLVKFDINGNRIWATYDGGTLDDFAQAVVCDGQNNIIIGGVAQSTSGISTSGTFQPNFGGNVRDGFAVKFNAAGNRIWGTYYGGSGEDMVYGVTADSKNNVIISGSTYSVDNIATPNSYQTTGPGSTGDWTAFVAKLNSVGNRIWCTYYGYGGLNSGYATGVVCDDAGNVFVCGNTGASTNVSTCNAVQPNWGGNGDMFVGLFSETIIPLVVSVAITDDPDVAVCSGIPVKFTALATNGGIKPVFQWQVNGVNVGTDTSEFTSSTLINGDLISCIITSSIPCIVNPKATSNIITAAVSTSIIPSVSITTTATGSICKGTSVTFNAMAVNGGNSPAYQWQINGVNAGSSSAVFTTSNLSNGDVVKCILTNSSSCNSINSAVSNSIIVTVSTTVYPSISITDSLSEICFGAPVIFKASAFNGGNNPSYNWELNGSSVGSGNIYTNSSLSNGDTVQCFLVPSNTGCYGSSEIPSNKISILIDPIPTFAIRPINPSISLGDTLQLSLIDTASILNYNWTPNQTISNNSVMNPRVWPTDTQTYTLEASSLKGCKKDEEITVAVISRLFIPNAFTPNNDGINDRWEIKGIEIYPKCTVKVYNRFGELVFKSTGYKTPWDGTYENALPSMDVFVYIIDLKNGSKPLKGTITILR